MGGSDPASAEQKAIERPLDGLLVLDFSQFLAGPSCALRLGDFGATVIKIERPEGDFARFYDAAVHGLSSYFVWLNRGKQSLVADLKDPGDAALLHRILARTCSSRTWRPAPRSVPGSAAPHCARATRA